ncbi:hypothetical protein IWX62_003012 [Arthrobacter sp. CAN_A1]
MISNSHVLDALADSLDNTRAFMAHHGRGRHLPFAVKDVPVRTADARRAESYEHRPGSGLCHVNLDDLQG